MKIEIRDPNIEIKNNSQNSNHRNHPCALISIVLNIGKLGDSDFEFASESIPGINISLGLTGIKVP